MNDPFSRYFPCFSLGCFIVEEWTAVTATAKLIIFQCNSMFNTCRFSLAVVRVRATDSTVCVSWWKCQEGRPSFWLVLGKDVELVVPHRPSCTGHAGSVIQRRLSEKNENWG